jgi:hypothetical protein
LRCWCRDAEYTVKCRQWKSQYKVVPGVSWGELPHDMQEEWKRVNCDEYLVEVKPIVPSVDCTATEGRGFAGRTDGLTD